MYLHMLGDAATNYDLLKEALLKHYNLSEDGHRQKFHKARPEKGESPEQFKRLKNYLCRWVRWEEFGHYAEYYPVAHDHQLMSMTGSSGLGDDKDSEKREDRIFCYKCDHAGHKMKGCKRKPPIVSVKYMIAAVPVEP